MNHYYTKLSFEKLEHFDMQRSNLSTFVLIRNTLIHALTQQQQEYYHQQEQQQEEEESMQCEEVVEDELMEQQIWLDSCFHELEENQNTVQEDEEEEEDSDEDDMMPLSPQDHVVPFSSKRKPTFYINEDDEDEEDGLLCYDIPYLPF